MYDEHLMFAMKYKLLLFKVMLLIYELIYTLDQTIIC